MRAAAWPAGERYPIAPVQVTLPGDLHIEVPAVDAAVTLTESVIGEVCGRGIQVSPAGP